MILTLIVLGLNDTSTPMVHFVSSLREREKRARRDSRGDEREGQGRKRKIIGSEETEEIKTFPIYPYLLQGKQALPNCKPISVGCPSQDCGIILHMYICTIKYGLTLHSVHHDLNDI